MSKRWRGSLIVVGMFVSAFTAMLAGAQTIHSGLLLHLPREFSDSPLAPNPIEAMLVSNSWKAPAAGERVVFPSGEAAWESVTADANGWFSDSLIRGREYFYTELNEPADTVLLLDGMGHDLVYVNGVPLPGNPYSHKETYEFWETRFDYSILPVELKRGENHLLFQCSRGRFKAELFPPPKPVRLNRHDITQPDIVRGEALSAYLALPVINATRGVLHDLRIRYQAAGASVDAEVPSILPLSVRKVGFPIQLPAVSQGNSEPVLVSLLRGTALLDSTTIVLRVVGPLDVRRLTFRSNIDGSVQYYAIRPALRSGSDPIPLILSLHGAGVEALGQAGAYESKPWAMLAAPTNRRPYGFNWEDWGRIDAFEVLNQVMNHFRIDTDRIYLTGHSMGGHGAWQIGGLFPDKWAAVGPSAGWITYWSYRIRGPKEDTSAAARMLRRALATSETPDLIPNFLGEGLYILHGSDDDNVPIQQSYLMVDKIKNVLHDYVFHEQPHQGHWWDISPEPGADCVDWPPMMDYFARHRRPGDEETRVIDFVTANPGVSSQDRWVTIASQQHPLELSTVDLQFDPGLQRFSGTTKNVLQLGLDTRVLPAGDSVHLAIDSSVLELTRSATSSGVLWLRNAGDRWTVAAPPDPSTKNPARYGPFKEAFNHNVILVYGTHGSAEENRLILDRVRYDEEKFWYQGNGSFDVAADRECTDAMLKDRNVMLYGNANSNSMWTKLLPNSPIVVERGEVRVGGKKLAGKDLCALFIRPRSGSPTLSIGAVGATGEEGLRLLSRVPYFNSYLGVPDLLVLRSSSLRAGKEGMMCAGFFGNDWSLDNGEICWSEQTH